MSDANARFDETDEILTCEVSDEALEIAACTGNEKPILVTFHYCTFLNFCPGP